MLINPGLRRNNTHLPTNGLTLDLRLNGSLPAGFTFTRTSQAWNPETGEIAPHNLLASSADFSNATYWTPSAILAFGSGSVANAATAPDGTMTADFICEDTSGSAHRFLPPAGNQFTSINGETYTFSIYAKASTRSHIYIRLNNSGGDPFSGTVRLTDGAVTQTVTGTITSQSVGNGWYRIKGTGVSAAASTTYVEFRIGNADTYANYTGDGTSGIYVWGAQLERYSSARDYIPTTTAAVYMPRYVTGRTGQGILIEEASTNVFLNSVGTAAVTQDISVTTANSGKWTCTVTGAGTVTSSAGTATATGYGAATAGTPNTITVTGNGTVTYTVSGADATTKVQVENKAYSTSHIVTTTASVTRNTETLTFNPTGILTAAQGTVSLWVNIDSAKVSLASNEFVFFSHVSSGNNDQIFIEKRPAAANRYAVGTRTGSGTQSISYYDITLTSGWHLLTATWTSSELAIWVNGIKTANTIPSPNLPGAIGTACTVGSYSSGALQADMPIDNLRIYNRVLSASEIMSLYRAGR